MGVSINTAAKAFKDLERKGFIATTQVGALGVEGCARGPSYELTDLPMPGTPQKRPRCLYAKWSETKEFDVAKHPVNNPYGRAGHSRHPSSQQDKPVFETDTFC